MQHSSSTTGAHFSLPQPTLPPIPSRIQERIPKVSTSTSPPYYPNPCLGHQSISPKLSLSSWIHPGRITPSNPRPPPLAEKLLRLLLGWKCGILPIHILLNFSCALHLLAYQCIITLANSLHPLYVWVSYDTKFRTKAANDPSLRWDIRDLDFWLECFPGPSNQRNHWPCHHCSSTQTLLFQLFLSLLTKTPAPANSQQRTDISRPQHALISTDSAVNKNCKFSHRCDTRSHPAKNCFAKGQFQSR